MIEWIHLLLEVIAIACVFLGMTIVLMMMYVVVKRIRVLTKRREDIKMSKQDKREMRNFAIMLNMAMGVYNLYLFTIFVIIFYTHKENLIRLKNKKENKIKF